MVASEKENDLNGRTTDDKCRTRSRGEKAKTAAAAEIFLLRLGIKDGDSLIWGSSSSSHVDNPKAMHHRLTVYFWLLGKLNNLKAQPPFAHAIICI